MSRRRAEMPPDPAAEAQLRAEKRAAKEKKKEKARRRAKESYDRRRAAEKGAAAQTSAPPEAEDSASQTPPPADQGPLGDVAAEAEAAAAADQPAADSVQLAGPEELALALANLQRTGLTVAIHLEKARLARVVAALQWADREGRPTKQCLFACSLAWPWIEQNGLATLDDFLTPGILALAGAALLLGPAVAVGIREYKEAEAEAKAAAKKPPAAAAGEGARVIDAEFRVEREEAA